mmetsp:Transcript_57739/g.167264  ORF Transcript_57739/g.167264 Transcript_57739/m.167264 type:complete len:210 (+) Transcript_57739:452-1081(+)
MRSTKWARRRPARPPKTTPSWQLRLRLRSSEVGRRLGGASARTRSTSNATDTSPRWASGISAPAARGPRMATVSISQRRLLRVRHGRRPRTSTAWGTFPRHPSATPRRRSEGARACRQASEPARPQWLQPVAKLWIQLAPRGCHRVATAAQPGEPAQQASATCAPTGSPSRGGSRCGQEPAPARSAPGRPRRHQIPRRRCRHCRRWRRG